MNKYIIGVIAVTVLSVGSMAFAQAVPDQTTQFGGSTSGYGSMTGYGPAAPTNTTGSGTAGLGVSPTGVAPYGPAQPGTTGAVSPARGLGIVFSVPQAAPAGAQGVALALIGFDGSQLQGGAVIPAIPLEVVMNGATPDDLTNCSLRNAGNLGTPLNTGTNALGQLPSTASAITLQMDTPLVIPGGSSVALALTCDIAPQTPAGSTVTISINPAAIPATDALAGGTIVSAADISSTSGQPLPTYGTLSILAAGQTGTSSPHAVRRGPGIPNTGAGGQAPFNYALLALSGVVILLGGSGLATRVLKVRD